MSEHLEVKVKMQFAKIPGKRIGQNVRDEAAAYFMRHGKAPKGVKVTEVQWRNATRKNPELKKWRSSRDRGGIRRAFQTLHLSQMASADVHYRGEAAPRPQAKPKGLLIQAYTYQRNGKAVHVKAHYRKQVKRAAK